MQHLNWSKRGFNVWKHLSKELILQETTMSVSIQTYRNWMTRYGNWFAIVVKSPDPRSKEISSHKSCNSSQSMYSSTSRKILKLYGLICVNLSNFMKLFRWEKYYPSTLFPTLKCGSKSILILSDISDTIMLPDNVPQPLPHCLCMIFLRTAILFLSTPNDLQLDKQYLDMKYNNITVICTM